MVIVVVGRHGGQAQLPLVDGVQGLQHDARGSALGALRRVGLPKEWGAGGGCGGGVAYIGQVWGCGWEGWLW